MIVWNQFYILHLETLGISSTFWQLRLKLTFCSLFGSRVISKRPTLISCLWYTYGLGKGYSKTSGALPSVYGAVRTYSVFIFSLTKIMNDHMFCFFILHFTLLAYVKTFPHNERNLLYLSDVIWLLQILFLSFIVSKYGKLLKVRTEGQIDCSNSKFESFTFLLLMFLNQSVDF